VDFGLLLIPLVTGLIGWITNALAIRMLFWPLRRVGWRRLSWQGVLPANADRMATTCVQLMTSKLLDEKAVFKRIEPSRISALLGPTIEEHAEGIVEDVLARRFPRLWKMVPELVREKSRNRLRGEIPNVVEKMMAELHDELDEYLNIESLVVNAFSNNRALLNKLFWRCGSKEFMFVEYSGLMFGALLGCIQMVVWIFVQPGWFLPLTGITVGWATNWIALKMVFEPLEPVKIGPFRWQGLFLRRQDEVSEAYAAFFAKQILHSEALLKAVLEGPAADKLIALLQNYVDESIEHVSGAAGTITQLAVGTEKWESLKSEISESLAAVIPHELDQLQDYMSEAMALEQELCLNLKSLTSEEFEEVLRPVFREDESTLIAVGAFLGGVAGFLQLLLMVLL
jgi:uncharacterized membrane protein YheB (UPF0754 family)